MLDLTGKAAKGAADAGVAQDVTDATFMAEVVDASRSVPVIVDFWAPWCGPCRQLTPVLEKVVAATRGAVRLVKINVDENPRVAGQLRVQSIPTVYAFLDGQPVDGFQGALPESQVRAFVDRLAAAQGPTDAAALVEQAEADLEAGDVGAAAEAFAHALQTEPENPRAIGGLARCYLKGGDLERAREILALAPEGATDAALQAARSALALAEGAAASAGSSDLERRVAADPADLEARFDLAGALAGQGQFARACDLLLDIIEADRDWRDGEARRTLLTVFEAAGPASPVARAGRRRLSALLFA